MHVAVTTDRHEIISTLLQYHVDYAARSKAGRNIAHLAAQYASPQTILLLARSNLFNLDVNLVDRDGKTPASYLAERVKMHEDEVGIHDAFQTLVASIPKRLEQAGEEQTHDSRMLINKRSMNVDVTTTIPGAFPF